MHKLLARQLRRAGLPIDGLPEGVRKLLDLVDAAYLAADDDRVLVERSLDLTSQELLERNCQLREQLAIRVRAEASLRASEERFHILFDRSPLAILVFDPDSFEIVECNHASTLSYGYSREELLGRRITDLKVEKDDPDLRNLRRTPSSAWNGTKTHRRKDGTSFDVAILSHVVLLDGRPVVLAMGRDVTQTKRLEDQLRESQKLEAVGLLAGGLAHDFNNLLSVIISYSALLSEGLPPTDPMRADLGEIEAAGSRAARLTRQLLAFSRKQVLEPRVLCLNDILEGMRGMLQPLTRDRIELAILRAPDLGNTDVDPGQIEQVILNLMVNARDAMPNGGTVTFETANVTLDDASARGQQLRKGEYVMLAVSDTGVGMDEATRSRVFEPFFTTKPRGKGTGLGLATVFGIVTQSGGHATVESTLGVGTTLRVYLPRTCSPSTPAPPQNSIPAASSRGTETVLVLEDDDQVREVARSVLRGAGYVVLGASNAGEALLVCEQHPGRIDLLLTDVVLPRLDGVQAATRLSMTRPEMRVLFMSGHTDDAGLRSAVSASEVSFLQKPFTPRGLASKVRSVLDMARR